MVSRQSTAITLLRWILPLLVLAAGVLILWYLVASKEAPKKRAKPPNITRVDATRLTLSDHPVIINTRGTVRPRTQSTLIAEVGGLINAVSPSFRNGGFFKKGEVLLKLDAIDYETRVVVAESSVAQTRAALEEEKARSDQALETWKRLGRKEEPGPLVLRKPQLAEAEAQLAASEAELRKAQRDLERTNIIAPYEGRVLNRMVDIGQFVGAGTSLMSVYAVDYVEIRLPLSNDQLTYLNLPERYANDAPEKEIPMPKVIISGKIGRTEAQWEGKIVRPEGAIDEASRQLFVVAQVDNPYERKSDGTPPLKIGMFVEAAISGETLHDVIAVPRAAVRPGGEVILIEEANTLKRATVDELWGDDDHVFVARNESIDEGVILCLTPLPFPADGARVSPTIDGVAPAEKSRKKRANGKGTKPGGGPA